MSPEVGQHVIVVFKNGHQVFGEVVAWGEKAVLKHSEITTIVIPDVSSEILYYKLRSGDALEKIKDKPIKTDDDIKALAELKTELNSLEKEEIAARFSTYEVGEVKQVQYGSTKNIPVKSFPHNTRKEIPRQGSAVNSGLQNLFGKKHKND